MALPAENPRPKSNGLKALIRRLHFYAGMFIGPFILVAALSGAAYALAPSMENLVYGDILKVQPAEQSVPLQQQVDNALASQPEMTVAQVWPATKPEDSTRVLLVDESLGEERLRSVFVDPGNGKVIGSEPSYSGLGELPLRRVISSLHESLMLGAPGESIRNSPLPGSGSWRSVDCFFGGDAKAGANCFPAAGLKRIIPRKS